LTAAGGAITRLPGVTEREIVPCRQLQPSPQPQIQTLRAADDLPPHDPSSQQTTILSIRTPDPAPPSDTAFQHSANNKATLSGGLESMIDD
jgi:hypothetical protein